MACIFALAFLGIGYAYWNDSLDIIAEISMGSIKPVFVDNEYDFKEIEKNKKLRDLDVDFEDGKKGNNQILKIQGSVVEGYEGSLHYCIANEGSIAVRLNEEDKNMKYITDNGITLTLTNDFDTLDANSSNNTTNGQLQINALRAEASPESSEFKFELRFKPETGIGWEKKLIVMGKIEVKEPESDKEANSEALKGKSSSIKQEMKGTNSETPKANSTANDVDGAETPDLSDGQTTESQAVDENETDENINTKFNDSDNDVDNGEDAESSNDARSDVSSDTNTIGDADLNGDSNSDANSDTGSDINNNSSTETSSDAGSDSSDNDTDSNSDSSSDDSTDSDCNDSSESEGEITTN